MRKESKGAVPIKFARTEQTTNRERTPLTFFRLSLKFNVRMRKAHTAHAWSQKGALRPGNIKSHSSCCVAFNAEKRACATQRCAGRRSSHVPHRSAIVTPTQFYRTLSVTSELSFFFFFFFALRKRCVLRT